MVERFETFSPTPWGTAFHGTRSEYEKTVAAYTRRNAEGGRSSPDDIRALGWSVAVHNDYRQGGEMHTFWLFSKEGRCVKGEGLTDADALDQVRQKLNEHPYR